MKTLVTLSVFVFFSANTFSQNITNTLGTGGLFSIKDNSTTFLSLSQSTGYLSLNRNIVLPITTSSSVGIIYKGPDTFIHNYAPPGADGYNTFIGTNSGNFNMIAPASFNSSNNTVFGAYSLISNTTGYGNSAIGFSSLRSNSEGYYNSAVGTLSLNSNTIGYNNTAIGYQTLSYNTSGNYNSGIGVRSLLANTGGNFNTALGYLSLRSNITGSYNTSVGSSSLESSISGLNIAVGYRTLNHNYSGVQNTALGSYSMESNTEGNYNTAIGDKSLFLNITGYYNTAIGTGSLYNNSIAYQNTAVGFFALAQNTTGTDNTAIGSTSMWSNTTGTLNTAIGNYTLTFNTVGHQNTAVGCNSLEYNTEASNNTAIGFQSLRSCVLGFRNTALGSKSGSTVRNGSYLTLLGFNAQPREQDDYNQVIIGDNNIEFLRCNVTSITGLSDRHDKKNIADLSLGLDFISKLKPRQFNWDKREWYDNNNSDGSKMEHKQSAGFIAQELDEIQISENAGLLKLVAKDNPEKLEATPGNLLPVMVYALRELKNDEERIGSEVELLKSMKEKVVDLEHKINELVTKNEKKSGENK